MDLQVWTVSGQELPFNYIGRFACERRKSASNAALMGIKSLLGEALENAA